MIRLMQDDSIPERLTPKQVAALLNVGVNTLCAWRKAAKGPPYKKHVKKVYYLWQDVEAWENREG